MALGLGLGLRLRLRHSSPVAGFTPTEIPDLYMWYDASDTSTITEVSGKVSQIDDKSGNGFHIVQGSASKQPTTGVYTLNGKNVIYFTIGNVLGTSSNIVQGANFTVFIVSKDVDTTLGSDNHFFRVGLSWGVLYANSLQAKKYAIYNGRGLQSNTPATNDTSALTAVFSNSEAQIRRNGVQIASGSSGPNTATDIFYVGGINGVFYGKIAEIRYYNRVLLPAEIEQNEIDLIMKWGL